MKLQYTDTLPKYMESLTNIKNATARQYEWLYSHGCLHHHRFTSHFNCFLTKYGIEEKIAYLDTEFYVGKNNWGRLAGDWGFFFSWVVGDGKGNYSSDLLKQSDLFVLKGKQVIITENPDKRIVASCIKELKKYDRVITQYGDRADIPLLRTRALTNRLIFPSYGELFTTDLWKIAKNKLCLSSNSQKSISKLLFGKTEKTAVEGKIWLAAVRGDKKALDEIIDHCFRDVRDLERNAKKLLKFIKLTKRSI